MSFPVNEELCYRALLSRDARFDGRFFAGVRTTGIYCRSVCPARKPKRSNVVFFRTAAEAEMEGLRTGSSRIRGTSPRGITLRLAYRPPLSFAACCDIWRHAVFPALRASRATATAEW